MKNLNKKNILILLSAVFALAIFFSLMLYFFHREPSIKEIESKSTEFVEAWGNYSDETSQEYFDSFSKYVSTDYLSSYTDSASEMKELRGNETPPTSTFEITSSLKTNKNSGVYNVELAGLRKYSYEDKVYNERVFIIWEKTNIGYRITDAYTEKE